MSEHHVTQAGVRVDTQYFTKDYEQVHCAHGNFVGYPGGVDYICGLCEDNRFEVCTLPVVTVGFEYPGTEREMKFKVYYTLGDLFDQRKLWDTLAKIGGTTVFEFGIESYWGTMDDLITEDWTIFFGGDDR